MKKVKLLFLILCLVLLTGCGRREKGKETEYLIYNLDKDENRVESYTVNIAATDTKEILQILFTELQNSPEKATGKSAIPEGVKVNNYSLNEGRLVLDFSVEYQNMNAVQEVLSRAAIVRTLCQVDGIEYVSFAIEGEPLVNRDGYVVGLMTENQFVDNAGNEINSYEKAELTLYFANASGNQLEVYKTECIYNSNISLDKLVVEKLIEGPDGNSEETGYYATINSDTQILSVATQDGVCFVNLNENMLMRVGNTTPEVAIYSIVNSILELPGINRVQLSVEGNSELNYMETISIAQPFEKNLDIVDDAK